MNKIIKLFMIIFLFKGLIYAIYITPESLGSSPDDVGHMSYIQYIVANKELPLLGAGLEANMFVNYNLSFYDNIKTNIINSKSYFFNQKYRNWIGQHPPLHYAIMAGVYFISNQITDNFYDNIYILRIISIIYGILLIYVLGVILKDLKVHMIAQICILSIVTFSPAIQFYFSTIGNDSLIILLTTVVWMFYIKYVETYKIKFFILYVIFFGLLIMTKYTGVFAVIATIPMIIYYTIKKYGYKKSFKILSIGFIICVVIIAPYFIRNYIELGEIAITYDKFQKNYNMGVSDFIIGSHYFDSIINHIILLIGWRIMITPDKIINLCVMMILLLFIIYSNRNVLLQKSSIAVIFIVLLGCAIIEVNIYISYIIAAFILMYYSYIMNIRKNNMEINIPISLSIIIEFIVFFYTHYIIFLTRGHLGAMHGRYFYPILFPALYVLGYGIIQEKEEKVKFLPLIILAILIYIEIHGVLLALKWWH